MDGELATAAIIAGYWQAAVAVVAASAFSLIPLWAGRLQERIMSETAQIIVAVVTVQVALAALLTWRLGRHMDAKTDALGKLLDARAEGIRQSLDATAESIGRTLDARAEGAHRRPDRQRRLQRRHYRSRSGNADVAVDTNDTPRKRCSPVQYRPLRRRPLYGSANPDQFPEHSRREPA